jgi:Tfp pilus assembly protein PilN
MYEAEEKQKLIKKERSKLNKILKDIDDSKKKNVEKLIDNAAWMAVSLEELRQQIDIEGYEEEYRNGANQCGKKDSIAVKNYNTLIKNYTTTVKLILDQLPVQQQPQTGDALAQFLLKN